jgi:hypothetical protein
MLIVGTACSHRGWIFRATVASSRTQASHLYPRVWRVSKCAFAGGDVASGAR